MENTDQESLVGNTTPKQIAAAKPKKNEKIPIAFASVLILVLIGVFAGYFLFFQNQKKNVMQITPQISRAPNITVPISPTSTANAPTKVVTIPINHAKFVKDVVAEDRCNNPIGVVGYHSTKNDTWMMINSLLDTQNKYSKDGLAEIEAYLNNSISLKHYQDINSWEFPFRNYCGGSSNLFVKELPGISYPNTESSKAMIVYTTQSMHGQVTVIVLAKNGNDIIQLNKYMIDQSLYQSLEKACPIGANSQQEDYQQSEKCYRDKLREDTNLQNAAANQAKALVSEFAIE